MSYHPASDARPEVSVIVPCHNASIDLANLLQSLLEQQYESAWEVVFVDNNSDDESISIAEGFSKKLRIRIICASDRANACYARNIGARAALAEKLLFVDADDELEPGYVAAMTYALESHSFVTSRVDFEKLNPEWIREAYGEPWQGGVSVFFNFMPGTGINIGIRRSLFESLGGFPEEFSGSQDIAFSWRAQLAGSVIHYVPDAVYRYRFRKSLVGLYRQCRNWGFSNVLLYVQFREHGMPGRSVRTALQEWFDVIRHFPRARSRKDFAGMFVRLGYCVGRLEGSLRYRIAYL